MNQLLYKLMVIRGVNFKEIGRQHCEGAAWGARDFVSLTILTPPFQCTVEYEVRLVHCKIMSLYSVYVKC